MDHLLQMPDQLRPQLQALRRKRGLTQAQLGEKIGVTQARIVEIEANPGVVSLQQIVQILVALGTSLVIREPDEADPKGSPRPSAPAVAGEPAPAGQPAARKGRW